MVSPSILLALRASESTMPLLAMLFFIVPVIEMVVLIEVGRAIGSLPTIALVFLTAVEFALLRQQGAATLLRAMRRMDHGRCQRGKCWRWWLAAGEILTPGFVTDALPALSLTRRFFLQRLLSRVQLRSERAARGPGQSGTIHIIEGK